MVTAAAIAALDPAADRRFLLLLGAVFIFLAATQDVATDGLAVRLLWQADRGLGNEIQVGGYYLGQILGGGPVLVLVDRLGWSAAQGFTAVLLFLPLPLVALPREPAAPFASSGRRSASRRSASFSGGRASAPGWRYCSPGGWAKPRRSG